MSPDLEKRVIEDLEKTGFPSEFKVRNVLSAAKWMCSGISGFFDLDEQKQRQLDVVAWKDCRDFVSKKEQIEAVWSLIIEVKKSEQGKPWVVFKEKNFSTEIFGSEHSLANLELVAYCNLPAAWDGEFSGRIGKFSYCHDMRWLGYAIHESFKQPSESSRPYNAMVSVAKAAEHWHMEAIDRVKSQKPITSDITKHPTRVTLTRPLIVLDGELLTAELNENGELVVNEVDIAPMFLSYKSPQYRREGYRLDVVRLTAFNKYLEFIEKQHNTLSKSIFDLGGVRGCSVIERLHLGAQPTKR